MVYTLLSVLQRFIAYHTLYACSLQVRYADCVHRMRRLLQVVVARLPIGVAPRLQIRVGRFDSGPSLHHSQPLIRLSGFFFFFIQSFCTLEHGLGGHAVWFCISGGADHQVSV